MAGTERMEWHQRHGNHVFDTIPLQPLPQACPPQLKCHQPPVNSTLAHPHFSTQCVYSNHGWNCIGHAHMITQNMEIVWECLFLGS